MPWFGLGFADSRPSSPAGPAPAPGSAPASGNNPPAAPAAGGLQAGEAQREMSNILLDLLPWGISALLHAGVVLLSLFIVWTTVKQQVQEDAPIIPVARLSANPGGSLQVGTPYGSTKLMNQIGGGRRSLTGSANAPDAISGGTGTKVGGGNMLIGVVGSAGAGGSTHGLGKANPFGAADGLGIGDGPFRSSFGGTGGNARLIAYVIDASGSLVDTLPFVINELKRSLNDLSDQQKFTVIFFQDEQVLEPLGTGAGLQPATQANKAKVIAWLGSGALAPSGQTSPMNAVKKALSYKPQLMFILSDNITGRGKYEVDQKTLLAEIDKANLAGTKINTIQFLYPDPLTKYGFRPTLEQISEKTGGIARFVDARELGFE